MTTRLTGLGLAFSRTHAPKGVTFQARQWLTPNTDGTGPAEVAVLVGDRNGLLLGELMGDLEGAAWKLNTYGQARLTLAASDATAREEMLRPGNRLLLQFGNGLPDWGGIIDPPRRWRDGRIEVVGYSGEYLLGHRITDRGRYFTHATAGEIFRALLKEAKEPPVEVGSVWLGGALHGPDYHLRDLLDIVQESLTGRLEDADWRVEPFLAGGRIRFRAHYLERRGYDHGRRLALIEGVNAVEVDFQEQGPIDNEIHLAGAGTGWSEDARIYAMAADGGSQGEYGLRQRGGVRVDVTMQATLDNEAATLLDERRDMRRVLGARALDRPPARFGDYDVGDTLWLELYSAGFGGYGRSVRVMAREFLPRTGECSLVVE